MLLHTVNREMAIQPALFPVAMWDNGQTVARFVPGVHLDGMGLATHVLAFVWCRGRFVLASIPNRGWCVPGGSINPGETATQAIVRETYEEVGWALHDARPFGYWRLERGPTITDVACFTGSVPDVGAIPTTSESCGSKLVSLEELPGTYYMWDPLLEAVFASAWEILVAQFGALT